MVDHGGSYKDSGVCSVAAYLQKPICKATLKLGTDAEFMTGQHRATQFAYTVKSGNNFYMEINKNHNLKITDANVPIINNFFIKSFQILLNIIVARALKCTYIYLKCLPNFKDICLLRM